MTTQAAEEAGLRNPRAPGLSLLGTVRVLKQSRLALDPGMAGHRLDERTCCREHAQGRGTGQGKGPRGRPGGSDGTGTWVVGFCLTQTDPRLREAERVLQGLGEAAGSHSAPPLALCKPRAARPRRRRSPQGPLVPRPASRAGSPSPSPSSPALSCPTLGAVVGARPAWRLPRGCSASSRPVPLPTRMTRTLPAGGVRRLAPLMPRLPEV